MFPNDEDIADIMRGIDIDGRMNMQNVPTADVVHQDQRPAVPLAPVTIVVTPQASSERTAAKENDARRSPTRKRRRLTTPNDGDVKSGNLFVPPVPIRDLEMFYVAHSNPDEATGVVSAETRRHAARATDRYAFAAKDPLEMGDVYRFVVFGVADAGDADAGDDDAGDDDADGLVVQVRYYIYDPNARVFVRFRRFSEDGHLAATTSTTNGGGGGGDDEGVDFLIGRSALDRYLSSARCIAEFVAADRERARPRQRRE
ncbi:MAG: hypothetical protein CMI16_06530 [Opitutaceae bacterium]|nr:hypothetical protein [Opitutaceae bacterium]